MNMNPVNLSDAINALDSLKRTTKAACRYALNQSLVPMVEAYRQQLSGIIGKQPAIRRDRKTGQYVPRLERLYQTPAKRIWNFPDGTGFAGLVGPKSGRAPHAHLVEHGTKARFRKKIGGKYYLVEVKIQRTGTNFQGIAPDAARETGTMPALQPLQKAFNMSYRTAQGVFKDVYAQRLAQKGVTA